VRTDYKINIREHTAAHWYLVPNTLQHIISVCCDTPVHSDITNNTSHIERVIRGNDNINKAQILALFEFNFTAIRYTPEKG